MKVYVITKYKPELSDCIAKIDSNRDELLTILTDLDQLESVLDWDLSINQDYYVVSGQLYDGDLLGMINASPVGNVYTKFSVMLERNGLFKFSKQSVDNG